MFLQLPFQVGKFLEPCAFRLGDKEEAGSKNKNRLYYWQDEAVERPPGGSGYVLSVLQRGV